MDEQPAENQGHTWADRIPAGLIRGALRKARARNSLRALARAVGVSPPTISKFATGGGVTSGTMRKFSRWYVADLRREREAVSAMLGNLYGGLPAERQEDAVRKTVAFVVEMHRSEGAKLPPLIHSLLEK